MGGNPRRDFASKRRITKRRITETLGNVRRRAISHPLLQLFLGGLLGEGEAGQLALHLRPLTNSKNIDQDSQGAIATIAMMASHILNRSPKVV